MKILVEIIDFTVNMIHRLLRIPNLTRDLTTKRVIGVLEKGHFGHCR